MTSASPVKAVIGVPVLSVEDMQTATLAAQASLAAFWEAFDDVGVEDQAVMVRLNPPVEAEVAWVRDIGREEYSVTGYLPSHALVSFGEPQIVDWRYRKEGRYFGRFWDRALVRHAADAITASPVASLAADLSPTPVEI